MWRSVTKGDRDLFVDVVQLTRDPDKSEQPLSCCRQEVVGPRG